MREIVYLNLGGAELFVGIMEGAARPFLRNEGGGGFMWGRWVVSWDCAWWRPAR